MAETERVRALIIKQGDHWIAQCLEYDIAAQATNFDQLRTLLLETVDAEWDESLRRHKSGFAGLEPAPSYFHDRWERRSKALRPTFPEAATKANVRIEFAIDA